MPSVREDQQFEKTPQGWQAYWQVEMDAARREVKKWQKQGDDINKRYLDERDGREDDETRINLFTSNVQTLKALLFGKLPSVDVARRFADASDDIARTAAEMLERLLTTDIERNSDSFQTATLNALEDRLIPGLGVVRLRYVADFREEVQEAIYGEDDEEIAPEVVTPVKEFEDVEVDYIHWRDFLWSPARTWNDVRWIAFRAQLTRKQLITRFGKIIGSSVPLNAKTGQRSSGSDAARADPWSRAEVWEIWDKESETTYWWVDGHDVILDMKEDPLELDGFFPVPKPMFANATTSKLLPRPDFVLCQDLYDEIDSISSRITLLERAIKVAGLYNRGAGDIEKLLDPNTGNQLIPVDNWAMFAEKGGIKGQVDWMPLEEIVIAVDKLREYRNEMIQILFQVSGFSDIMRGQAQGGAAATATEQAIKARFASVRVQQFQDEFARFVSDTQRIKAEIISKHFDPQTIIKRSNVEFTYDAQTAMQAVQLIKDQFGTYRIEVKPESVSLTDYAALKQERVEFVQALSQFMGGMAPVLQMVPQSLPVMLEMLKWMMAGFKGSSTIEGVLDRAILVATQNPNLVQPPQKGKQENPEVEKAKVQTEMMKAQGEAKILQMKGQTDQAKAQADMQKTAMKSRADMQKIMAESQASTQEQEMQAQFNIQELEAKLRADGIRAAMKTTDRGETTED